MTVSTRRFAQWVVIEVPGFRPSDSWFHLPPGAVRTLTLFPEKTLSPEGPAAAGSAPAGVVRALNAQSPGRLVVERW
jgi:beta-mannosidase